MGYTYIPHQQYDTNPIHPKVNTSPSMVPNMCKCPTKPRFLGECLILGGIDCQECGTVGVDKFDRLKYPISISNLGYPFKNGHWTVSKSFRDSNRSHFEIPTCTGFVGTHSWRVPCIESCEFLQQAWDTPKEIKKTQVRFDVEDRKEVIPSQINESGSNNSSDSAIVRWQWRD